MIGTLVLALAMTTGMELTKTSRDIKQNRGEWIISYRLKNPVLQTTFLRSSSIILKLDGTASNSTVRGDGLGRRFHITASETNKAPGHFGRHLIHGAIDGSDACRIEILVYLGENTTVIAEEDEDFLFKIVINHEHQVYGLWEPILGKMTLDVDFGEFRFRDDLDLERSERAAPKLIFNVHPDARDGTYSNSAPNSVYIASHDPCKNNYAINNISVRYGTKLRFSFRYLVAVGTDGNPQIDLTQEGDYGSTWRRIRDADFSIVLTTVGKWQEYSGVIAIDDQASLLDMRFRIPSSDFGEVWIADLELKEVGFPPKRNP